MDDQQWIYGNKLRTNPIDRRGYMFNFNLRWRTCMRVCRLQCMQSWQLHVIEVFIMACWISSVRRPFWISSSFWIYQKMSVFSLEKMSLFSSSFCSFPPRVQWVSVPLVSWDDWEHTCGRQWSRKGLTICSFFTYIRIELTVFHPWKLRGHLSGTPSTAFPFLESSDVLNCMIIIVICSVVSGTP